MKSFFIILSIIIVTIYGEEEHSEEKPLQQKVSRKPKNVIIIMADDMAFHDVSFRGSNEIPTPNIDALAYSGIVLNRFYTPPLCTPSRASFMTGKYPHTIGMQQQVVLPDEPFGLPLDLKLIPQYFKDAGYKTHLIGKWHLGFFKKAYTPTLRGFDTYLGNLGPYLDYYDYTHVHFAANYSRGYDMRRDMELSGLSGTYATDLFNNEAIRIIKEHDKKKPLYLQVNHLAPRAGNPDKPIQYLKEDFDKFSYIKDEKRRGTAANIYRLDLSVGEIVKALKKKDLLKNSVVVFMSDNGGPTNGVHSTNCSNYPLRGQKESAWEGGVRTNAIIFSPNLPKASVRNEFFHIADFLPTLKTLSNADFSVPSNLDGVDQSWVLKSLKAIPLKDQPRKEVIFIDEANKRHPYTSYILNGFKVVNGSTFNGAFDTWLGVNNQVEVDAKTYAQNIKNSMVAKAIGAPSTNSIKKVRTSSQVNCNKINRGREYNLLKSPCLFDIINDPCEYNDLSVELPEIFNDYMNRIEIIKSGVVPSLKKPADPMCDPKFYNYTWTWWKDIQPFTNLDQVPK